MLIPFGVFSAAGAGGGGGGASYELISTTTLTGTQTSITFTDAGSWSGYKHLQLRVAARSDRASGTDSIKVNFNSDTASNYSYHRISSNGSSVSSGGESNQSKIVVSNIETAGFAANIFGSAVLDILDFKSTSKNKTLRSFWGATGDNQVGLSSGAWFSTSAVTSITLALIIGPNFVSGSRFSLYGIKG